MAAAKTILIVDDDQTLVAPLKDGLETLGYRVAVAFDGVQGILQANQAEPDVVILDINMPGGGGPSVYERLRQSPATAKIPVIFSTVVSLEEVKGSIGAGSNVYFLKKPVGLNQIVAVINQILGPEALPSVQVTERRASAAPPDKPAPPAPPDRPVPPAPSAQVSLPSPKPLTPSAHRAAPRFHEFSVRVTYADTDKMGIIYYANYLRYFEQGRTELLRSLGVRYRDLEVQRKLFIPAMEARCTYLAPSRYDDLLIVRTWIAELGRASISFEHEIYDQDLGGKLASRGYSRHAVVNDLWRPARVPDDLRRLLEPFVGKPSA